MSEFQNTFEEDKRRVRMWLLGISLGLVALAMLVWLGRTPYRHWKEQRGAAEAKAFLEKGDIRNAVLSARVALAINSTNLIACRVMAAVMDISHSPAILDFLHRIATVEPTIENKLALASAGLRYQNPPYELTQQILESLEPTAANVPAYHVISANWALGVHRLGLAERHFEAAASLEPTNRLYQLNVAVVRLGMTNETKAAGSRVVLEKLVTDASLGPPALRALIADRLGNKDASKALEFSSLLLSTPRAALADKLRHIHILRLLKNDQANTALKAVQQSAATNAVTTAEVAEWMQGNELLAEEIQWLTNLPANMLAQNPVRLVLAEAYLESADWKALRDFTSQGDWEEMDFLRLAMASHAWLKLEQQTVADSNWSSAVSKAGKRFSALSALLGLAERWEMARERGELLLRIFDTFPNDLAAGHQLEQLYFTAGDTPALNRIYARMFSARPKNLAVKNNLAFTCLLLKTNLPNAFTWAREDYLAATNAPVLASTYAYALHLQGRATEGTQVLKQLNDQALQQPDMALYYAVLLAASGASNEAASYFKIARTKTDWLPEEKRLFPAGSF